MTKFMPKFTPKELCLKVVIALFEKIDEVFFFFFFFFLKINLIFFRCTIQFMTHLWQIKEFIEQFKKQSPNKHSLFLLFFIFAKKKLNQYHHIKIPQHHNIIITPQHYNIITSQHHNTTTPQHHNYHFQNTTTPQHHNTTIPHHNTTTSLSSFTKKNFLPIFCKNYIIFWIKMIFRFPS